MEAELTALAASGATTLMGLMVSDAWARTRQRLERFFARGGADEAAVGRELQLSQEELRAARDAGDETAAAGIEDSWRTRLRRALHEDPAAAAELRALLEELGPAAADGQVSVVSNTVSGGVQYGPVVQGRDFSGLTFYAGPPPAGPAPAAPPPRDDRAPGRPDHQDPDPDPDPSA